MKRKSCSVSRMDSPQASETFRLHSTQFNMFSALSTIDPSTSAPKNYDDFPCRWTIKQSSVLSFSFLREILDNS